MTKMTCPFNHHASRPGRGFTLIELLIVVAIIAILAAIAVPNFLEGQVRAKITREKADLRTLSITLESYRVDQNAYPIWNAGVVARQYADNEHPFVGYTPPSLTTPIGYLTALPRDPFKRTLRSKWGGHNPNPLQLYIYDSQSNWDHCYAEEIVQDPAKQWNSVSGGAFKWVLVGVGPDGDTKTASPTFGPTNNIVEVFQNRNNPWGGHGYECYYDPSNGSTSDGDIVLVGPSGDFNYHNVAPAFEAGYPF